MIKNVVKHIILVLKHKWVVFKLCCKIGIPFRGLIHDLSKFSPSEFFESVKYYNGKRSPLEVSRERNGYTQGWLHHKGRNKHHLEYWVDFASNPIAPVIPYKYAAEMVCDKLSAGIVYLGKNWTQDSQLNYWNREKTKVPVNPKTEAFLTEVFTQVKDNGIDRTLTKENIKKIYNKFCKEK